MRCLNCCDSVTDNVDADLSLHCLSVDRHCLLGPFYPNAVIHLYYYHLIHITDLHLSNFALNENTVVICVMSLYSSYSSLLLKSFLARLYEVQGELL